jgi:hypothetical protein
MTWAEARARLKKHRALGAVAAGIVVLGGAGAVVTTACTCATPTFPPTPGTLGGVSVANLWVTKPGDAQGSCTRSASQAGYVAATSCGNAQYLDQAVNAASPGDTIGVPGGTYSTAYQTVGYEARLQNLNPGCDPLGTWGSVSTANCIRIAPQTATQPFIQSGVELHTGSIWVDGSATGTVAAYSARTYSFRNLGLIDTEADTSAHYPDHVTVTGWNVTGGFAILGSHNVRFSQMQSGRYTHNEQPPGCGSSATALDGGYTVNPVETNAAGRNSVVDTSIYIDHTYLNNVNTNASTSCDPHDGCFFLHNGVTAITFDSDVWQQCWVYDIEIQAQGDGPTTNNVTMQNSWFGVGVNSIRNTGNNTTPAQRPLQFDGGVTWTNYLVRFNSFDENGSTLCATGSDCSYSNVRFVGNAGAKPATGTAQPCGASGVTFSQNAWISGTCGASDASASSPLFVSFTVGTEDFALHGSPGSTAADGLVTSTGGDFALATDINGTARTAGAADAGSVER